jgi:Response regulator receiver domain
LKVGNRASIRLIISIALLIDSLCAVSRTGLPESASRSLDTQFDASLSSAFPVQLAPDGSRTGRAMPKTILVADDNAMIRNNLCRIFEIIEDYDICGEAVNGEEAISLAMQHKPDLIVLDFQMPGMKTFVSEPDFRPLTFLSDFKDVFLHSSIRFVFSKAEKVVHNKPDDFLVRNNFYQLQFAVMDVFVTVRKLISYIVGAAFNLLRPPSRNILVSDLASRGSSVRSRSRPTTT